VLDGGIVVSMLSRVWNRRVRQFGVRLTDMGYRICFANKLDRTGASYDRTIKASSCAWCNPIAMQMPIGMDHPFSGSLT